MFLESFNQNRKEIEEVCYRVLQDAINVKHGGVYAKVYIDNQGGIHSELTTRGQMYIEGLKLIQVFNFDTDKFLYMGKEESKSWLENMADMYIQEQLHDAYIHMRMTEEEKGI